MDNTRYRQPMGLLTDLYQLTMAYGYWKLGRAEQESVFHLFFREPPFDGGYAVTAGLEPVLEYLESYQLDPSDIEYLGTLVGNDGAPLFEPAFLDYLADVTLSVDVDAMREGTLAFGHEPLLRVRGSILQCQLLETPLLNLVNFQTLIATKAARICSAAAGQPVLEFGLRRAQGVDGGLAASRAAYIGGCAGTSNVLAGKLEGIPVKGTHAHSWVMSFDDEPESFRRYAEAMPNNCVFLVDTYDTLQGVRRAVEVGHDLRRRGHSMVGIRLDSGDLRRLSLEARKILDESGFPDAIIVASNDLDEHAIERLREQDAPISVWGVGTRLVTGFDQPALGGVYKLGALKDPDGTWQPKIKRSEQALKTSIPGVLQVRRYRDDAGMVTDMIYDERTGVDDRSVIVDPHSAIHRPAPSRAVRVEDLLQPVFRDGRRVATPESIHRIRDRAQANLRELDRPVRQLTHASPYPVGLDVGLHELRKQMIGS